MDVIKMKTENKTYLTQFLLWSSLFTYYMWTFSNLNWFSIPIGISVGIIYVILFKKLSKDIADVFVGSIWIFICQMIFQNWFYSIAVGIALWLICAEITLKKDFYIKKVNINKLVMPILCVCTLGFILFKFLDLKWIGVCIAILLGLIYRFIRNKFNRYIAGAFWIAVAVGVVSYTIFENVFASAVFGVMVGSSLLLMKAKEQGNI